MRQVSNGLRGTRLLALNIARAWRWHVLGFRLATFGIYEPHRWWQVNPRVAWLLLRHTPSYGRWLVEMEAAPRQGRSGWWEQYAGRAGYDRLCAWMIAENGSSLSSEEASD